MVKIGYTLLRVSAEKGIIIVGGGGVRTYGNAADIPFSGQNSHNKLLYLVPRGRYIKKRDA